MDFITGFFLGPWSSAFFIGNMLDYTALLIAAGLASAIAFRAGLFNIGLEGQIYAGGLAAGALLITAGADTLFPAVFLLCVAALVAMLCGALMGLISGLLKVYTGANEIISSFLLASALNPFVDYCITGPLRDSSGNLLASKPLGENLLLMRLLPPSNLSISLIIALLLPLIVYVFINKTAAGYRFRIAGASPEFARYGGINAEQYWIPALALSGALGALTGFFAVTGSYGIVHQGFSGGIGWAGLAVALIARKRPLAVIPAALFYAYLRAGAENILLTRGVGFNTTEIIKALVLILATIKLGKMRNKKVYPLR